jgi:glycosyltransferase EpsF
LADKQKVSFDFCVLIKEGVDVDFLGHVKKQGNSFFLGPQKNNFFLQLFFYVRLYLFLRKQKYDIVQVHSVMPLFCLPCIVAKLARVPRVYFLMHGMLPENPPWTDRFFRMVSRFFIKWFTDEDKRFAVSQKAGLDMFGPHLPFRVYTPGIETKNFAFSHTVRAEMRKKLNLENNFVFGCVARLSEQKNLPFLLDIFQELHRRIPNSKLTLVGDGPLKSSLEKKAEKLGILPFVLFLGALPNPSPYYQAMDVFILPSFWESLGLVALEAQSAGLPCFFSDRFPPEINVCNTTFLSLSQSADVWSQTILENIRNFKREDGSSAVAQAGFDLQDSIRRIENIYLQGK